MGLCYEGELGKFARGGSRASRMISLLLLFHFSSIYSHFSKKGRSEIRMRLMTGFVFVVWTLEICAAGNVGVSVVFR